jgi:PIN domain nuclease of toxin-antitoxin system
MKLLLDTHIVLALLESGSTVLPASVMSLLRDGENRASVASLWEIAIKWRLGKLRLTPRLTELPLILGRLEISLLGIDARHALADVQPAPSTRDPFDRMLLAQCTVEGLKLLTLDRALADHPLAAGR